jgi:hypothetical protein
MNENRGAAGPPAGDPAMVHAGFHGTITRRQFVVGTGTAVGALLAGCGPLPFQQPPPTAVKVYRLGFLSGSTPAAQALRLDILLQALGELGYVEGQNLVVEYRWGDGDNAPLVEAAVELARLPVDAFVVSSVAAARLAREATTTVPIVLAGSTGDPIGLGLAASYARPGGTVTGKRSAPPELGHSRALAEMPATRYNHSTIEMTLPVPLERWLTALVLSPVRR